MAKKKQKPKKVQKSLKDLKKSRDVFFRKRAEKEEALLPVSDLNTEIKIKQKSLKGTKSQIQAQKNKIKNEEKQNKKISTKEKSLLKERKKADPKRKQEIDKILKSPDLRKKDLSRDKNYLKALEGKPFDFIVDDGFVKYKLSSKEIQKAKAKGIDPSLLILKKMQDNTKKTIKHYEKLIKEEKPKATKARMKKLNRIKDALEKKLTHTIQKNIDALEDDNLKELDEYNEFGEKAYSILFRVVGFNIDRIGI